jgi:hypothetical protein
VGGGLLLFVAFRLTCDFWCRPTAIIHMLSQVWKLFDDELEKYKCTRVKTLGDCYVFVSDTSLHMTAVSERASTHGGL